MMCPEEEEEEEPVCELTVTALCGEGGQSVLCMLRTIDSDHMYDTTATNALI